MERAWQGAQQLGIELEGCSFPRAVVMGMATRGRDGVCVIVSRIVMRLVYRLNAYKTLAVPCKVNIE
jgi:hypothetical protein